MTTISELITDNWPVTEATLSVEVAGFEDTKLRAIARASRELYKVTPPAETAMPAEVLQWIADKATAYLVSVGIDYYADQYRRSDSKEGMTVTYYDRVEQLKALKVELEADCREGLDVVLNSINAVDAPEAVSSVPAVSVAGLLVDPTLRAWQRGPF